MKPSPPQALLLRELEPMAAHITATPGRKDLIISAAGYDLASEKFRSRLNPSTINALIKNGWIIPVESKSTFHRTYVISPHGRETLKLLKPDDFIPKRPDFTADEIGELLFLKYQPPEWIFFRELYGGTGTSSGAQSRMDAWAMNTWPCKDLLKIAFEIKVYRSDFLKELKDAHKRDWALRLSNQFYFVAPKGIISVDELPADCGLMTVDQENGFHTAKAAPFRKIENPPWTFIAALGRDIIRISDSKSEGEKQP